MIRNLRLILGIILLTFFAKNTVLAQSSSNKAFVTDWTKLYSNTYLDVSYEYTTCNMPSEGINAEYVFLQFKNTTNKTIIVEYSQELNYNGKCFNCDGKNAEMNHRFILKPYEIKQGSCEPGTEESVRIFSKRFDIDVKSTLSDFNIKNIVVTEVK
jgi:hypothetical protein